MFLRVRISNVLYSLVLDIMLLEHSPLIPMLGSMDIFDIFYNCSTNRGTFLGHPVYTNE